MVSGYSQKFTIPSKQPTSSTLAPTGPSFSTDAFQQFKSVAGKNYPKATGGDNRVNRG